MGRSYGHLPTLKNPETSNKNLLPDALEKPNDLATWCWQRWALFRVPGACRPHGLCVHLVVLCTRALAGARACGTRLAPGPLCREVQREAAGPRAAGARWPQLSAG